MFGKYNGNSYFNCFKSLVTDQLFLYLNSFFVFLFILVLQLCYACLHQQRYKLTMDLNKSAHRRIKSLKYKYKSSTGFIDYLLL